MLPLRLPLRLGLGEGAARALARVRLCGGHDSVHGGHVSRRVPLIHLHVAAMNLDESLQVVR